MIKCIYCCRINIFTFTDKARDFSVIRVWPKVIIIIWTQVPKMYFFFEYFSEFKLLITGAPGNYYQEFLEGLVQLDTDCTKKFLIQVGSKALAEGRVTDGFLHVVSSAFYSGIFEVVIHDMPMEEAKNYINELRTFYGNGWKEYYRK